MLSTNLNIGGTTDNKPWQAPRLPSVNVHDNCCIDMETLKYSSVAYRRTLCFLHSLWSPMWDWVFLSCAYSWRLSPFSCAGPSRTSALHSTCSSPFASSWPISSSSQASTELSLRLVTESSYFIVLINHSHLVLRKFEEGEVYLQRC